MNVMLIDDEEKTREGILKYINWKKLGIDKVYSFSNPEVALSQENLSTVDIVLSDIRMPQMDGVTLCQKILKKKPNVRIIFISGYSDKEYLMKAIQIAAIDYIEKPINIEKLEVALEKAIAQIAHADLQNKQTKETIDIISKNRQLYLAHIVNALIRGVMPSQEIYKEFLQLSEKEQCRNTLKLSSDSFYRVYLCQAKDYIPCFLTKINAVIKELMAYGLISSVICSEKNEYVCLIIVEFRSSLECDSLKIDSVFIQSLSREGIRYSVCCSYGGLVQGCCKIVQSYNQAVVASQKVFFTGYGRMLSYSDFMTEETEDKNSPFSQDFFTAFMNALKKREQERCFHAIQEMYDYYEKNTQFLPNQVRNEYYKMISCIVKEAEESAGIDLKSGKVHTEYLWQRISVVRTLSECHEFVLEEMNLYFSNINSVASNKKIILDVIHIIQNNFSNSLLCINQIAQQVYLTPNYLSLFFKKETGKTIGAYLTETRLEQSTHFLTESNMKISEIAKAVGYVDADYYSKVFKQHYNMSPINYRNRFSEKTK